MLGVVLWSDAKDGKAVFWCEDQGDLAYFEVRNDSACALTAFCAGDMVQFDVSTDARLRRARNPKLVKEQAYSGLPETLRQNGKGTEKTGADAKVVQLRSAPVPAPNIQLRSQREA